MVTDNRRKKPRKEQEAMWRQFELLLRPMKVPQPNSGIQRYLEQMDRDRKLMRVVFGPVEELRRSGLLDASINLGPKFEGIKDIAAKVETQFRLPDVTEAVSLLHSLEASDMSRVLATYRDHETKFQQAVKAMRTPWLDVENHIRSLNGFVGLQGIGSILQTKPVFDEQLADQLRLYLGDWRSKIDWPPTIFTDPLARTDFYVERGLDLTLTDFPSAAFDQSLTIAGIKADVFPMATAYDHGPKDQKDEEAGFRRTNTAHDLLQRFESHLRKFIEKQMKKVFGENWIKHQVPGSIRQDWCDKQKEASINGAPEWPLIAYADFTHYEQIILRKDNWERVFEPIFKRKTLVQEAFQRLYPIRVCTMHARIITQDDELYLYVEVRRLLGAMDITI